MEGKRYIESIRLSNILSFGPDNAELPLEPLNVLIGPNASGKSNLIEALSLLAATPRDLQEPIREGGGVRDWLWKGGRRSSTATIGVTLPHSEMPLRYRLAFIAVGARFFLMDEVVEDEKPGADGNAPSFYYRYERGNPVVNVVTPTEENKRERHLMNEEVTRDQSILSQRRGPSYPELSMVGRLFGAIRFYRDSNVGRHAPVRLPQKTDLQQDFLLEDASNLSLVLNDLQNQPHIEDQILARMRDFYSSIEDINTPVSGGTLQIFFREKGLRQTVPATRLSDGSLRYLCLLTVLCHPTPPRIVCIEEPELGLHPDVIPEVAKLLVEASSRCQLFVTTHSDVLVDALTDVPEAVIVCEKLEGATQLRRLEPEQLKPWLEQYRLGELWTRGEIGGNRW